MSAITEKQILEWKEELKTHKERKEQAVAVVEQETKFISMIEGGIQFGEMLLKKNESEVQQSNKEDSVKSTKPAPSN
jgi:hypothetical protein|tara:strand:- start:459 stop:689 length:231 start_codon:yes stop_codon:yes gene_type:complete